MSRPLRRSGSRDPARKTATARWPWCGSESTRPAARQRSRRSPPLASAGMLRRERMQTGPSRRVPAGRRGAGQTAPGRPQVRPASVPEVTVGVDGVVVVLEPSRRRRCVRRPLPSDAGSSPKDTQLSEQICASEQHLKTSKYIFALSNWSKSSVTPDFTTKKKTVCTLGRANFDAVALSLVLVDHPRRALRSVGGLKHVTWRHFAWLRWPNVAEAGPEILRAYIGPSRLCVGQFVPHTDNTWPI